MTILRNSIFALFAAAVATFAGVDSTLLSLVPADAKVISGISVDQSKTSAFGQYVLTQMNGGNPELTKFVTETGFDPRRDLNELVIAAAGTADAPQFVVFGRGVFNPSKIFNAAKSAGVAAGAYKGIDLLIHQGEKSSNAIGFFDATTAVMGSTEAVKSAIDRRGSGASLSAAIQTKVRDLAAANDAWFLSTGPITNLFPSGAAADPNMNQMMNGNLFQAVLQANGGVKFSPKDVRISGEALTRSDKDAQALSDVIRFIAGLVQTNSGTNAQTKKVASLLDSLTLSTQGATAKMTLSIPEDLVEKLFIPDAKVKARKTAAQVQ